MLKSTLLLMTWKSLAHTALALSRALLHFLSIFFSRYRSSSLFFLPFAAISIRTVVMKFSSVDFVFVLLLLDIDFILFDVLVIWKLLQFFFAHSLFLVAFNRMCCSAYFPSSRTISMRKS